MFHSKLFVRSFDYTKFEEIKELIDYDFFEVEGKYLIKGELKDFGEIFLLPRVEGVTFKNNNFPKSCFLLVQEEDNQKIIGSFSNLKNIAWVELYNNLENAKKGY